MRLVGLAFLAGVLIAGYRPEYQLFALVGLPFLLHRHLRSLLLPGFLALCAGGVWLTVYLSLFTPATLHESMDGQSIRITGKVVSIPGITDTNTRFDFEIDEVLEPAVNWQGKVRLSWYHAMHEITPGQQWQLEVKLKPAHGFVNPGGFDYESWLFSRRISATGYVRRPQSATLLDTRFSMHAYRQALSGNIRQLSDQAQFSGILVALVTGDRQYITRSQWQVLSRTGTSHLMAISGLHIGLVYGLFYWLGSWGWRLKERFMLYRPAQDAGILSGLVAALAYAALAGFSIPTLRALVMLSVIALALWRRRMTSPLDVLQTALVLVLLIDPLAIMSAGFWLSFMAVALILFTLARQQNGDRPASHALFRLVHIQWVLGLGLLPLTSLLFSQVSIIAPLMNLVAVPSVGLLVVPITLAGSVFTVFIPAAASLLLDLSDALLQLLWAMLLPASQSPYAVIHPAHPSLWVIVCSSAGIVLLLYARNWLLRVIGLPLALSLFLSSTYQPGPGEFQLDILDVGQGLAVVVRTTNYTLLYDTGYSSQSGFDIGRQVVLPYLWHQGIGELDHVMLSHDDRDHTGGFAAVQAGMPVHQLSVMPGSRFLGKSTATRACASGQHWNWDGIDFHVLHPEPGTAGSDNNRSCVLRVSGPGGSVLLTGDIEAAAEQQLVRRYRGALAADVLLAPHHGSATSSSAGFVQTVRPREVIYSAGFRNRYGFPRPEVTARYDPVTSRQFLTADTGMLRYRFSSKPGQYTRHSYRADLPGFRSHAAKQQWSK